MSHTAVKKTRGDRWHIVESIGADGRARACCGLAISLDAPATERLDLSDSQSAGVYCKDCVRRGPRP